MNRYTRLEVYAQMKAAGIIPVFFNKDIDTCKKVLDACYKAGLRIFELTNRGDFAHELFSELNQYALAKYPDIILGVGTIVDAPTTALYIQLGANFIVSPVLKEDMALVCNRRKVPWLPGCGSVTEIAKAEELGAEVIKIFPASQVGGPAFVKAIKGPCPWTNIMPSGGVAPTVENLKEWFDAGAFCVGIGSKLLPQDLIKNNDFAALENHIKKALNNLKKARTL